MCANSTLHFHILDGEHGCCYGPLRVGGFKKQSLKYIYIAHRYWVKFLTAGKMLQNNQLMPITDIPSHAPSSFMPHEGMPLWVHCGLSLRLRAIWPSSGNNPHTTIGRGCLELQIVWQKSKRHVYPFHYNEVSLIVCKLEPWAQSKSWILAPAFRSSCWGGNLM